MKSEFKPFKAKPLASDWKTELADLAEWAPMDPEIDGEEPMETIKQIYTFLVRDALLNMRRPR